jgi:hypothetical protein
MTYRELVQSFPHSEVFKAESKKPVNLSSSNPLIDYIMIHKSIGSWAGTIFFKDGNALSYEYYIEGNYIAIGLKEVDWHYLEDIPNIESTYPMEDVAVEAIYRLGKHLSSGLPITLTLNGYFNRTQVLIHGMEARSSGLSIMVGLRDYLGYSQVYWLTGLNDMPVLTDREGNIVYTLTFNEPVGIEI